MRRSSQRVPGKNFRQLGGKPLFHHIIATLLEVPQIDEVVVNTDSPEIIDGLQKSFPSVRVLERPEHLQPDEVPMNEVLAYDASKVKADFYLQTHSTNPLLRAETISKAIQVFVEQYPAHDSLFSVTGLKTRLWDQLGRAINHNPAYLLQTQDLPPIYEENSCIYIFTKETLLTRRNRLGKRPLMFEIDAAEAWDIDEELDFEIVDFLMRKKR
ncbi:MAG: acylneuraminate cytidylyltransferase family protein [Chloroflexi bacterium]|nr:acylneuraminate cytidylyltransferase family protein [Chloroflexota bacterium]